MSPVSASRTAGLQRTEGLHPRVGVGGVAQQKAGPGGEARPGTSPT